MTSVALEVGSWVEELRTKNGKGGRCGVVMAVGFKGGYVEVLVVNVLQLCTHGRLKICSQEKMRSSRLRPFHGTGTCRRVELNRLFAEAVTALGDGDADEDEGDHWSSPSGDIAPSSSDGLALASAPIADEPLAAEGGPSESAVLLGGRCPPWSVVMAPVAPLIAPAKLQEQQ